MNRNKSGVPAPSPAQRPSTSLDEARQVTRELHAAVKDATATRNEFRKLAAADRSMSADAVKKLDAAVAALDAAIALRVANALEASIQQAEVVILERIREIFDKLDRARGLIESRWEEIKDHQAQLLGSADRTALLRAIAGDLRGFAKQSIEEGSLPEGLTDILRGAGMHVQEVRVQRKSRRVVL